MSNIKIFASHRIDLNSETVNNPLFIPVRCGAVYDNNDSDIKGDNTGDNISSRRMTFCEFTVQYWAWKNVEADYYGMCHYRRYLSFSSKRYRVNIYNMVFTPSLNAFTEKRYGLLNKNAIKDIIENHDVIVSESADVRKMPTPLGFKNTVYEHWAGHDGKYIERKSLDLLLEILAEKHGEYLESAREYMEGYRHRGYNCFIMRRELFNKMCMLQFDVMFEFEKRLDTSGYTEMMQRTPAFMGEILYGIYIYHLQKQGVYSIKELQLVFFNNTHKRHSVTKYFQGVCFYSELAIRAVADKMIPKGTQRREKVKVVYYRIKETF